jgi:leucyl-tRNA synthetase
MLSQQVFLAPATLRPETMYGQTNCFVLPEGVYGAYSWANGDVLIVSERGARGLAHQGYAKDWGKVRMHVKLDSTICLYYMVHLYC